LRETDLAIETTGALLWVEFTKNLYQKLQNVLREYITNSIDARAKTVEITIQAPFNQIEIYDDGFGMSYDFLENHLRSVGISTQQNSKSIGRFGVGIYAGTAVCEIIEIESKIENTQTKSIVQLPVGDWYRYAKSNPGEKISDFTPFRLKEEHVPDGEFYDSYTRIVLLKLKPLIKRELLGKKQMGEGLEVLKIALATMLPLSYNLRSKLGNKIIQVINEIDDLHNIKDYFPQIQVYINRSELIRPIPNSPVELTSPYFEINVINDEHGVILGFGWLSANRDSETIKPKYLQDVQLRLFDITLIDNVDMIGQMKRLGLNLTRQVKGRIIGEYYICNQTLTPTTSRNDLEEEIISQDFKMTIFNQIKSFDNLIFKRDFETDSGKERNQKKRVKTKSENIIKPTNEIVKSIEPIIRKLDEKTYKKPKRKRPKIDRLLAPLTLTDFIEPIMEQANNSRDAYYFIYLIENLTRRVMDAVALRETGAAFNEKNPNLEFGQKTKVSMSTIRGSRKKSTWFNDTILPSDVFLTYFEDLSKLIKTNSNIFKKYLKIEKLTSVLDRTLEFRNFVMHCAIDLPSPLLEEIRNQFNLLHRLVLPIFEKLEEAL